MNTYDLANIMQNLIYNSAKQTNLKYYNSDEWYSLYNCSLNHKVDTLLYYELCKHNDILYSIPSPILRTLRASYQYNLTQNSYGINETKRIIKACNSLNISIYPIRGIVLIEDIYSNIGVRSMQDIDLVAYYNDCDKINQCFHNLGYKVDKVNNKTETNLNKTDKLCSVLYDKKNSKYDYNRKLKVDITYYSKFYNIEDMLCKCDQLDNLNYINSEDHARILCCGLLENALESNSNPKPKHCCIGKLVDIIKYVQFNNVSLNCYKNDIAVIYAQNCSTALFGKNILNGDCIYE